MLSDFNQAPQMKQDESRFYTADGVTELLEGHAEVDHELGLLLEHIAREAVSATNQRAKEFLLQGAGRRLRVIRRALQNIFTLFPPSETKPLASDTLDDTQISLHAFVINVYGLFDNLAWAFVWRHGLENAIPRNQVGIFSAATKHHLPSALRSYFDLPRMADWGATHLKNYRDALAHRIPLYIPPASYSEEEAERVAQIERETMEAIRLRDWQRVESLSAEERQLGCACPLFMHSFDESERSRKNYLHPQVLADAKTVTEASGLFLAHWHEGSAAQ